MSRYTRLLLILALVVAGSLIAWQLVSGGGFFIGSH